jgi:hypothetical protein
MPSSFEVVEIMDAHKGFDIITASIKATKKKELLVIIGVLTFLFLGDIFGDGDEQAFCGFNVGLMVVEPVEPHG